MVFLCSLFIFLATFTDNLGNSKNTAVFRTDGISISITELEPRAGNIVLEGRRMTVEGELDGQLDIRATNQSLVQA